MQHGARRCKSGPCAGICCSMVMVLEEMCRKRMLLRRPQQVFTKRVQPNTDLKTGAFSWRHFFYTRGECPPFLQEVIFFLAPTHAQQHSSSTAHDYNPDDVVPCFLFTYEPLPRHPQLGEQDAWCVASKNFKQFAKAS